LLLRESWVGTVRARAAPNYAGYVAWRGTLDESDTPLHLVAFFDDAFTFSEARSGGHILVYFIAASTGCGTSVLMRG
jgi:FAD binding domain-like